MMSDADSTGVVEEEVVCLRCGYILRGLARDGQCPECGERVEASMRGRGLAAADPAWVRSLRWGAVLAGMSVVVLVAAAFLVSRVSRDGRVGMHLCFAGAFVMGGVGLWMLGQREPGGPYFDDRKWLRRILRGVAIVCGPAGVAFGLLELVWRSGWSWHGITVNMLQSSCATVAFPGALIAVMVLLPRYLAVLARRLPSRRLSWHGHMAMLSLLGMIALLVGSNLLIQFASLQNNLVLLIINLAALALLWWPGGYASIWAICVWRRCCGR